MRHFFHLTFFIISFFWVNALLGRSEINILNIASIKDSIDLSSYVLIQKDGSLKKRVEEIQDVDFIAIENNKISITSDSVIWLKLSYSNNSFTKEESPLLYFGIVQHITIHFQRENKWHQYKAGALTNYNDRAFIENRYCFPFHLTGMNEGILYIRLERIRRTFELQPLLMTPNYEQLKRSISTGKEIGYKNFHTVFLSILFAVIIFSIFQFRLTFDRSYLFYVLYLFGIGMLYLRNLEELGSNPPVLFFSYFLGKFYHVEPFITHFITIAYMLFFMHFLDIEKRNPRLNRFMKNSIYAFVVIIFLDFMVIVSLGLRESMFFFSITRTFFFFFSIYVVSQVVNKNNDRLVNYILVGTLLLLVPSFFTAMTQMIDGVYYNSPSGLWRSYTINGTPLYMYNVKVGILFEVFFFSLGLSYKTRIGNERKHQEKIEAEKTQLAFNNYKKQFRQEVVNRNVSDKENALDTSESFIQVIITLILKNIKNEDLNIEFLCRQLGLSQNQIRRRIKKTTDLPPQKFIQKIRLERARKLFETTEMNVSEVGYSVGFSDPAYFSRAFAKEFGKPPSDWSHC